MMQRTRQSNNSVLPMALPLLLTAEVTHTQLRTTSHLPLGIHSSRRPLSHTRHRFPRPFRPPDRCTWPESCRPADFSFRNLLVFLRESHHAPVHRTAGRTPVRGPTFDLSGNAKTTWPPSRGEH
ncbi:hypothetical protein FGIG_11515 [Fasciola gigantica]|uniref:Uncharacterized protein n=1 Tax=Fasciola gigantica TaxID=46835 RepID=A0A504YAX1_FASGI|nr:hypothetical protein FGIG_11515 [Fasciola gigantica]